MYEIYKIIRHMMEKGHKQNVILDLLEYFAINYKTKNMSKTQEVENMSPEELEEYIKFPHRFRNT